MQAKPLFEDGKQQVDADGHPNLHFDGIGRGAVEGLNTEMLLDPFEQLNDILPTNNALLKSRSITAFIRCAHKACR